MAPSTVGARVPISALERAAISFGLSPDTSKSAVIRGALALFLGLNPRDYMDPPRKPRKDGISHVSGDVIDVVGKVPAELTEMPEGIKRARAIRIGLAMANGWPRDKAEEWADTVAKGQYSKAES